MIHGKKVRNMNKKTPSLFVGGGWPRSQVAGMKIVSGAAPAGLEEANGDVNKRW